MPTFLWKMALVITEVYHKLLIFLNGKKEEEEEEEE